MEGFGGEDQRPRKRRLLSAVVKVCHLPNLCTEVFSPGIHAFNVIEMCFFARHGTLYLYVVSFCFFIFILFSLLRMMS